LPVLADLRGKFLVSQRKKNLPIPPHLEALGWRILNDSTWSEKSRKTKLCCLKKKKGRNIFQ